MSIEILESKAFRAWPALETRMIDGWIQRFADGYTKRANSINALGKDAVFTQEIKNALEAAYLERGLLPVWRLTPLAPPETDRALAAAGYRRIDESHVQLAPLGEAFVLDPEVCIAPSPSAVWLAGFAEFSPVAPSIARP